MKQVAGIILAAGMSHRMGTVKQLLPLAEKPLLAHVLEATLASRLDKVVLVLGYEEKRIREALGLMLANPKLAVVINKRYQEGLATSLASGLKEVATDFPGVMFLLGDQPLIDAETIDLLLDHFRSSPRGICVPTYGAKRGNPVCFKHSYYGKLFTLTGDCGAREIINSHPQDVLAVEIKNPDVFLDVDDPLSFEYVKKLKSKGK